MTNTLLMNIHIRKAIFKFVIISLDIIPPSPTKHKLSSNYYVLIIPSITQLHIIYLRHF